MHCRKECWKGGHYLAIILPTPFASMVSPKTAYFIPKQWNVNCCKQDLVYFVNTLVLNKAYHFIYSLCQKKCKFNSEFFCDPLRKRGQKFTLDETSLSYSISVRVYSEFFCDPLRKRGQKMWGFGLPPQAGHKKFGIKCLFRLTQTVSHFSIFIKHT